VEGWGVEQGGERGRGGGVWGTVVGGGGGGEWVEGGGGRLGGCRGGWV